MIKGEISLLYNKNNRPYLEDGTRNQADTTIDDSTM